MKKILAMVLIFFLMASIFATQQSASASTAVWRVNTSPLKIDPRLNSSLAKLPQGETITVIVTLRQQADLSHVYGVNRPARLRTVIQALQETSSITQAQLKKFLKSRQDQGKVKHFDSLWVFNGFSVTATSDVINELSQQPDVLSISSDDLPIIPTAYGTPEPNISLVNAPALWSQGYTGQGIVVANMDTGVDVTHPDLATRWRGGNNSWFDPFAEHPGTPTDLSGHGTWTMGVMVGGEASGTTIGVAPDAKWIAVKMFNDAGGTTATAIHQGFQWLLNPDGNPDTTDAPQVVNNSWTYSITGCYLDFEPDLQALRTAGILPIFAAGNGGPSANTSYSPANNPSAFAVGAINNNSQLYGYSSRGPTACAGSTGPYPKIVAPGVNVRTTDLSGGYYPATGTSLAAPHIAGGLALLLSAYPNLTVADQEQVLINSAVDLGAAGPDNVYGYGRLDLLAAFHWLAANSMHIGDLDRNTTRPTATTWKAIVIIRLHNSSEKPLPNATVTGQWSNGATGIVTCVTNSSGVCRVNKTGLNYSTKSSVTFTVTNVILASHPYQASANHDPDGESNGTRIVVPRP